MLPAHRTKHLPRITCAVGAVAFELEQRDDGGDTTGSTLWLGAQCLALYLADDGPKPKLRPRGDARLNSFFSLRRLTLVSLGWDVLATDVPVVLPLLERNLSRNRDKLPAGSGQVAVRELDWSVPPEEWGWDHPRAISTLDRSGWASGSVDDDTPPLEPPFDLILTADTLYSSSLTQPLLRTLHHLASISTPSSSNKSPPIYVCLERRDPSLIASALLSAKEDWGFAVERVPQRKVVKAMEKGDVKWEKDDWDGIEIWKMTVRRGIVV
ncbi:hypothetical protein PUNSTDRAFT_71007 [Punctularia strigosozonata HHB-11173 SS5]|uniref:uncharacterized protein n=1 Tax=Punctularia strigosozonata (strain HHB-11173) TaxID=741275 RepID=UPI00044181AA|nr:uncharacterized protein PUNSTDRAFT_71007 [Punctularia strigosozonata HHB-11173 SS5]EIN07471.1 hypothetical protein PUNSTDRAFT_71007 [Punctularia strigosozonata HHB-11173 SS5]